MKNLSLDSLCLTELNDSESINIDGGKRSLLTAAVGLGVFILFGPVGSIAFETGYLVNS